MSILKETIVDLKAKHKTGGVKIRRLDENSAMKELEALNKKAKKRMEEIMAAGVDVEEKMKAYAMEIGPRIEELAAKAGVAMEGLNEEAEESFDYIDDKTLEEVKKLLRTVTKEPMYSSPTIGKKSGDIHVWDKKRNHWIIKTERTISPGKR